MTTASCSDCGQRIVPATARAVTNGRVVCGDCLYHREQADAKRDERTNVVPIVARKRASA